MGTDELARQIQEAKDPSLKKDLVAAYQRERQKECSHINCIPIEWHWSGQIQKMRCSDCGLEEFREEV